MYLSQTTFLLLSIAHSKGVFRAFGEKNDEDTADTERKDLIDFYSR
jgi:hypothetical protein